MSSVLLRAKLESSLGSPAFVHLNRRSHESVSTGIPSLDKLTGGLQRGAVTEITGPISSGRTSIVLSIFAEATARGESVALVDGHDAFSPHSAVSAGVDLKQLLWIRCNNLDAVLKATDLILKGGGFGVVAVDVTDYAAAQLRSVPLTTWFRFQRTIENTPSILVVAGQQPVAQSCAALVLRMEAEQPVWAGPSLQPCPSHSVLLEDNPVNTEVVRNRRPQQSQSKWPAEWRHVRLHLHP
jgi:recombination protein RecA